MKDNKYELIIFDLIDTLAFCKGLSDVQAELIQAIGKEAVDTFINGGNIDKFRTIDEAMNKFQTAVDLNQEQEELVRRWLSWSENYLFEDSIEILKYLKNEGYKVGVISNSPPTINDQLLDLGIKEFIDEAIFSYEIGSRKPEKEIFLTLLQKLNIAPSRALMVGDSLKNDVNGARSIGVDGLLLDRSNSMDFNPKITNLSQLKDFLTI